MGTITRAAHEQAPELARRVFGLPLGADEEAADVLRYYFEHQLGHAGGTLPDTVTTLELPPATELFATFRDRTLGERRTGRWTNRARQMRKTPGKRRL